MSLNQKPAHNGRAEQAINSRAWILQIVTDCFCRLAGRPDYMPGQTSMTVGELVFR